MTVCDADGIQQVGGDCQASQGASGPDEAENWSSPSAYPTSVSSASCPTPTGAASTVPTMAGPIPLPAVHAQQVMTEFTAEEDPEGFARDFATSLEYDTPDPHDWYAAVRYHPPFSGGVGGIRCGATVRVDRAGTRPGPDGGRVPEDGRRGCGGRLTRRANPSHHTAPRATTGPGGFSCPELAAGRNGMSKRQIARTVGVSHPTVIRDTGTDVPSVSEEPSGDADDAGLSGTSVPLPVGVGEATVRRDTAPNDAPALSGEEAAKAVKKAEKRKRPPSRRGGVHWIPTRRTAFPCCPYPTDGIAVRLAGTAAPRGRRGRVHGAGGGFYRGNRPTTRNADLPG